MPLLYVGSVITPLPSTPRTLMALRNPYGTSPATGLTLVRLLMPREGATLAAAKAFAGETEGAWRNDEGRSTAPLVPRRAVRTPLPRNMVGVATTCGEKANPGESLSTVQLVLRTCELVKQAIQQSCQ